MDENDGLQALCAVLADLAGLAADLSGPSPDRAPPGTPGSGFGFGQEPPSPFARYDDFGDSTPMDYCPSFMGRPDPRMFRPPGYAPYADRPGVDRGDAPAWMRPGLDAQIAAGSFYPPPAGYADAPNIPGRSFAAPTHPGDYPGNTLSRGFTEHTFGPGGLVGRETTFHPAGLHEHGTGERRLGVERDTDYSAHGAYYGANPATPYGHDATCGQCGLSFYLPEGSRDFFCPRCGASSVEYAGPTASAHYSDGSRWKGPGAPLPYDPPAREYPDRVSTGPAVVHPRGSHQSVTAGGGFGVAHPGARVAGNVWLPPKVAPDRGPNYLFSRPAPGNVPYDFNAGRSRGPGQDGPVGYDQPSEHADVSPEKARRILHDGTANGHALTDKQRRFFGAVAGKGRDDYSDQTYAKDKLGHGSDPRGARGRSASPPAAPPPQQPVANPDDEVVQPTGGPAATGGVMTRAMHQAMEDLNYSWPGTPAYADAQRRYVEAVNRVRTLPPS